MKLVVVAVLAGITLAPLASAQKIELKFDALAAKASEKAEVDLDGSILKLLPQLLSKEDRDGKSPVILCLGFASVVGVFAGDAPFERNPNWLRIPAIVASIFCRSAS